MFLCDIYCHVIPDSGKRMQRPDAADANTQIGACIKAARTAEKLTLSALAEKCGLTESFLSKLERGVASASIANLLQICAALNIEIGSLFDGLGNAPARTRVSVHRRSDDFVQQDCQSQIRGTAEAFPQHRFPGDMRRYVGLARDDDVGRSFQRGMVLKIGLVPLPRAVEVDFGVERLTFKSVVVKYRLSPERLPLFKRLLRV